jgi:hypothetical protein
VVEERRAMSTVQFFVGEGRHGWPYVLIHSPYDPIIVQVIKTYSDSYDREWIADSKLWKIKSPDCADYIKRGLIGYGYTVRIIDPRELIWPRATRIPTPPPGSQEKPDWADAMFKAIPQKLHNKAYAALLKVLHPDAGGDNETMKQLNTARDRLSIVKGGRS